MKHYRMRSRNSNSKHNAITVEITVDGEPVTLRQIPKPMFASSLGFVDTIDYPDGELAVLCGCHIGEPEAIFGCFRCDCGEKTWFAATSNLKNGGEHANSQGVLGRYEAVSTETATPDAELVP
jgi:hypothetical protein